MISKDIKKYCVTPKMNVREVLQVIDQNKDGVAFVIDESGKLVGTITDGDIRRFILARKSLESLCTEVMWINFVTASVGSSKSILISLIQKHRLRSLPIVDENGFLKNLVSLQDLIGETDQKQIVVIMAGGEGKRLRPLTNTVPKPMVEVGGKPILENIIKNLSQANLKNIYIAVNYQAQIIEDYFEDGSKFDVHIDYLREKTKLGTVGALSLLPGHQTQPIIVMNGDVVTNINFARLIDFHLQHRSVMCIAASQYHINIPYGVLNLGGHYVLSIDEKPTQQVHCNAGIYVIEPELLRLIPEGQLYNMTDLINDVIRKGLPISVFPIHDYWVDIGQKEDLNKAITDSHLLMNGTNTTN